MSFIDELRRRNVFRVGAAYLVAAWLLLQLTDIVVPILQLPDSVSRSILFLLLIGFVIALILAWAYELTAEGIKREADVDREDSVTRITGRKLDFTIIALMATAIVYLVVDNYVLDDRPIEVADDQRSIAVLPFVPLSNDDSDSFFGKGIAEELLNALAQFPGLRVAARTSAFSFEGKDIDLREIGETLGVAHVLEGSVRRSGERLRVTAQLIRTADGFHLWSDSYERELTDIFAIQDEIVSELSRVLQFRLGVGVGAGRASGKTTTPQAYDAYLKGLDLWLDRSGLDNRTDAVATFLRVTELDPNFADGWAAYAASLVLSGRLAWPHLTIETYPVAIEAAFARALAIDPENVRALAGLAYWHTTVSVDLGKAQAALDRAMARAPNNSFVQYMAAHFARTVGDSAAMARAMKRSLADDPLNIVKQYVDLDMAASRGENDPFHPARRRIQDAIDICHPEKTCTEGDFYQTYNLVWMAIQAGSKSDIATAQSYWDKAFAGRAPTASISEDDYRCDQELHRLLLETAGEAPSEATQCLLNFEAVKNMELGSLHYVSYLALMGHQHIALEALFLPGLLLHGLKNGADFYALSDSRWQMPESIRRHPRYHEWWARPGMAELAAARRANGKPFGLPLPIERGGDQ
ncbi:MAG: hypothetical protein OER80_14335 [Gammaproteobacteria bacterium]|nr:hypothetical protein [Gammaproteobacteria bacterium]MDH3767787.1 hypothetical protein [Gammaproteobacteria bacterium]